ncbi:MAG: GntR family transcriptional regulator [Thermoanaerobaculia bacterium]
MFDINPSAPSPIWLQIDEGMRRMIALGSLTPGDAVPSVRDLAKSLRVNPNTVARAYQRLTDAGVFSVRRGEGTFVADKPATLGKSQRSEALRDAAATYAGTAISIGAGVNEAVRELETGYERLVSEHRRKA